VVVLKNNKISASYGSFYSLQERVLLILAISDKLERVFLGGCWYNIIGKDVA